MLRAVFFTLALSGCSAISYHRGVDRPAAERIDQARRAKAEKRAPYYYTLANEYLLKARQAAAYSDYGSAEQFGKKAEEMASKALKVATTRKGAP